MTRKLTDVEKEYILAAIINHGGILQAARALGIAKSTVYRKLRGYGLSSPTAAQIIQELNYLRRNVGQYQNEPLVS